MIRLSIDYHRLSINQYRLFKLYQSGWYLAAGSIRVRSETLQVHSLQIIHRDVKAGWWSSTTSCLFLLPNRDLANMCFLPNMAGFSQ